MIATVCQEDFVLLMARVCALWDMVDHSVSICIIYAVAEINFHEEGAHTMSCICFT